MYAPVMTDWENAVVVDPKDLKRLKDDNATLRRASRRQRLALCIVAGICAVTGGTVYRQTARLTDVSREAREYRKSSQRSNVALAALARSHENILAATEQAPSVGTKSWGRRFTVTMYIPRSPAYGRFNNGITSTLWKADPRSRIVAVDPKLIPYGSWVWIEGMGWYQAEDCGSAIKGFRLDLLTETEREAMEFGKQDRFVIVVPAANA
jgi:3D (Asp-Asp-Asp) domain-containing protein